MSNDQYGFSPTFEIDPYEDPRLDSLGNPIIRPPYGIDMNDSITIPHNFSMSDVKSRGITSVAPTAMLVQGKMLTTSLTMSPYEAEQMDEHEMKTLLISQMVREIWDNKCIEFTKQQDYVKDEVVIRARIYVTPDADVKVIRQMQK